MNGDVAFNLKFILLNPKKSVNTIMYIILLRGFLQYMAAVHAAIWEEPAGSKKAKSIRFYHLRNGFSLPPEISLISLG